MYLKSRLNHFFILFRLALLAFLTPLAFMLPYVLITHGMGDAHIAMKIFLVALTSIGIMGVVGEIFTYRHIFPTIVITEAGIQKRNFLGLGVRRYFLWEELSSYDTSSISMKGASAGVVKIFRGKRCVIEFNGVVYKNFKEMSDVVETYLNRLPNEPDDKIRK